MAGGALMIISWSAGRAAGFSVGFVFLTVAAGALRGSTGEVGRGICEGADLREAGAEEDADPCCCDSGIRATDATSTGGVKNIEKIACAANVKPAAAINQLQAADRRLFHGVSTVAPEPEAALPAENRDKAECAAAHSAFIPNQNIKPEIGY
jgi:hypothetical protein